MPVVFMDICGKQRTMVQTKHNVHVIKTLVFYSFSQKKKNPTKKMKYIFQHKNFFYIFFSMLSLRKSGIGFFPEHFLLREGKEKRKKQIA